MSQPRRAKESQRKQIYRKLDVVTLLNILLDNPDKPSLQREALDQLRTLPPDTRSASLIQALKGMVHYHTRNDVGVLTGIVDLLATDPNPEATRAMLDVLPIIAKRRSRRSSANTTTRRCSRAAGLPTALSGPKACRSWTGRRSSAS
jgi:hypothetical protein